MRFRDLRNGVEKVIENMDGTAKLTKTQWVTLSGVFTTLATLWADMSKTNAWAGKSDLSVTTDLNDTATKALNMSLTKAEKAKKAKALNDLMAQMAAIQQTIDNL